VSSRTPTIRARAIAARLLLARRDNGLSQAQFAAAIVQAAADDGETFSLDRSAIARWEAGTFEPALRYRKYIARVLDRDRRELFPTVSVNEAA
jgi:transcriptional regulator with XRE-family HTH domain